MRTCKYRAVTAARMWEGTFMTRRIQEIMLWGRLGKAAFTSKAAKPCRDANAGSTSGALLPRCLGYC
eukprot:5364125-Pyramimonas_sp.AAC.1